MNHQLLVNGKGYTAYFTKKCSEINIILEYCNIISTEGALRRPRVAEVAREHRWHPPKSLDSDENFKPKHTLFCRKLRFVAIYTYTRINFYEGQGDADMEYVKNFTPPYFQAKNFSPSISPIFNSFS